MTFTDAAREVLNQSGRPLHYKEITELAIEKNLLSHVGKSPEVTMGARLAATLKKGGDDNPLIRVKPGVFALRDWDEATIKKGLEIKRAPRRKKAAEPKAPAAAKAAPAKEEAAAAAAPAAAASDKVEGEAAASADAATPAKPAAPKGRSRSRSRTRKPAINLDEEPVAPDEEMRAEIAAAATEVFAEEDDDDQPILRPVVEEQAAEPSDGRRRRRRRRRRGSRSSGDQDNNSGSNGSGGAGLPSYTAAPAFDGGSSRGPQVIELTPSDIPSLDGAAGRELADAVALILGTFERTVGAVSLRQIAETAQRRGKLSGDLQLAQSQIAAAVRADNARRGGGGFRPRFRIAGGRVGLTDWLLDPEMARLERDLLTALKRYRDVARRTFARKAMDLPGHAFVELCLLLLERLGLSQIKPLKFSGASGAEAHFVGVLHAPAGVLPGPVANGAGVRVAVVVRRDGRDLGRERVTELRGSVHHYENAAIGWLLTAGQVLSGAREEAGSTDALPVSVLDGLAIARLCDEHNVAVVRSTHPVAIADVDLFEVLRSS